MSCMSYSCATMKVATLLLCTLVQLDEIVLNDSYVTSNCAQNAHKLFNIEAIIFCLSHEGSNQGEQIRN